MTSKMYWGRGMIVAHTSKFPGSKIPVHGLVNRGGWWGKTWLVMVGMGFGSLNYVVEADTEQDALDEFVDSKHGHLIILDVDDASEIDPNYADFAGNESKPVDLDNVLIVRCRVDYFAKKEA